MFCKNCGQPMNDNQAICLKCGVKTGDGTGFCPSCGQPTSPGAEYCLSCGVSLKANSTYLNGQDKVLMALVCFFLGGIGIHNFILGESKKGLTKILFSFCCGISGILALIDFVKILANSYIVEPDKYF